MRDCNTKTARGERTVALDALTVGVLRKHRAQQEELAACPRKAVVEVLRV